MAVGVHHHHHNHNHSRVGVAGDGSLSPSTARRLRRSPAVEMRRERERRRAREQRPRCGEVAGGTAAECAAVFCCFPFAVVELVVLAAVRVPAALCCRAVRGGRRRRVVACRASKVKKAEAAECKAAPAPAPEHGILADVEKEVWASFYGAGFWRSPSQREDGR
ncbi:uncharacterized protein LOC121055949 [Oryza brachyantha]|uniref:uncharacterized protein LOC121055949 n=1 Tax=Oryza brachyantha TaxID=4533 RepID=UPI001AD98CB1|nr:uncharacterized protein LOC121055949 [Oryza brachyantha]